MYFYDNSYYGDVSLGLTTSFPDVWGNHFEFGNYIYTNNADGSLGVYYSPSRFSGSTSDIQNFTSQITETSCNAMKNKFIEMANEVTTAMKSGITEFPSIPPSFNDYNFYTGYPASSEWFTNTNLLNRSFPNVYWDKKTNICMSRKGRLSYLNEDGSDCCNSDELIGFDKLMTQPLSAVTTIEDFEYYITSELIDVKSRKVLSGYPTLRALYDRYTNSNEYCPTTSSAFDYGKMDQFAHLIDSYWVDIVEQVVPATTIWGSVKIYGNTMFDQQKFQYKKSSLFTCTNNDCGDLDSVNACLFNLVEDFYVRTSNGCHNNVCYSKGWGIIDFLDDVDQMPTSDQIRSFGAATCGCNYSSLEAVTASHENAITTLLAQNDTFRNNLTLFKQQTKDYSVGLQEGFCDGDVDMETPDISLVSNDTYPNNFLQTGKPIKLKMNSTPIASIMEGWTANTDSTYGFTLQQIYSAYTNDFTYIKAVAVVGDLPLSGSAGDLIFVGTKNSRSGYAWDPIANSWSSTMYRFIEDEILTTRRAVRDAFIKAKQEVLLAMRPFTWANYHLLLHPIKLWALQDEPIITGNEIITSETNITPCSYEKTAEPCVTLPFCEPNKKIITPQC